MEVQPPAPEIARAILLRAAELVRRGWTQHAEARTADGEPVDPWEPAASSWSLLGALVAALEAQDTGGSDLPLEALAAALARLADFVDDDSLARWNDLPARSQDDVFHALKAAAVRL